MIEIRKSYESNVFATESESSDDLITVAYLSIRFKSDASRHSIEVLANAGKAQYADNTNENYQDMLISA